MSGAIVFDLDGTLIDSAPDLAEAVNRMLADEGRTPLDLPTVVSFVGNGLAKLVERTIAVADLDPADHERLFHAAYAHYRDVSGMHTLPYPGAVDALETLARAGHPMGICTNKPEGPAREILDKLGLSKFFGAVVGGDTLPVLKPDPAPLVACYQQLGAMPILYVGDSETDAATSVAGGLPFALYSGGYRKTPVEEIPHWRAFDSFTDLPALATEREAAVVEGILRP